MFDPKIIDDLSRKLADSLPAGLTAMQDDFRRNASTTLQAALDRLDLVTRDEFDVQRSVLERTRQKVDMLEAQVSELEKALGSRGD